MPVGETDYRCGFGRVVKGLVADGDDRGENYGAEDDLCSTLSVVNLETAGLGGDEFCGTSEDRLSMDEFCNDSGGSGAGQGICSQLESPRNYSDAARREEVKEGLDGSIVLEEDCAGDVQRNYSDVARREQAREGLEGPMVVEKVCGGDAVTHDAWRAALMPIEIIDLNMWAFSEDVMKNDEIESSIVDGGCSGTEGELRKGREANLVLAGHRKSEAPVILDDVCSRDGAHFATIAEDLNKMKINEPIIEENEEEDNLCMSAGLEPFSRNEEANNDQRNIPWRHDSNEDFQEDNEDNICSTLFVMGEEVCNRRGDNHMGPIRALIPLEIIDLNKIELRESLIEKSEIEDPVDYEMTVTRTLRTRQRPDKENKPTPSDLSVTRVYKKPRRRPIGAAKAILDSPVDTRRQAAIVANRGIVNTNRFFDRGITEVIRTMADSYDPNIVNPLDAIRNANFTPKSKNAHKTVFRERNV